MKFQQLAMGARFEYEGKGYTKIGPLTAINEAGEQRMIPRFAILAPLDGAVAETAPARNCLLEETVVAAAMAAYHSECVHLLNAVGTDPTRLESALTELEAARRRFFARLA
jgi:hypothetical protein